MRDNPIAADASVAGARTVIQAAVAGLVLHWVDGWYQEMLAVGFASGAVAVAFHLISEFYPKLGKVFSAGLAEGAARYIGSK